MIHSSVPIQSLFSHSDSSPSSVSLAHDKAPKPESFLPYFLLARRAKGNPTAHSKTQKVKHDPKDSHMSYVLRSCASLYVHIK